MIKIIRDRTEYPKAREFPRGQKFIKFKTLAGFSNYQHIQTRNNNHRNFVITENQFGEVWAID